MITEKIVNVDKSFEESVASEKPFRSVVKAISWRLVGTMDTLVVSLIVCGDFRMASKIASIEVLTKMILYFFHERVWNIIKWGK